MVEIDPEWLVAVSATHFPAKHWNAVGIPAAFRQLGTVVEIDYDCLEDDYSSVRVIIERNRPDRISDVLCVANVGGLGVTF
jgi:hypothetical protein